MSEPIRKGDMAYCALGCLGLITDVKPRSVTYGDGTMRVAYVGIHLTDKIVPIGSLWSAREPIVVGHVEQPNEDNEERV